MVGNHPNIINIVGICMEPPYFMLVTEYCKRGSIYDVLIKRKVHELCANFVGERRWKLICSFERACVCLRAVCVCACAWVVYDLCA